MTSNDVHTLLGQAREELRQGKTAEAMLLAQNVRRAAEVGSEHHFQALAVLLEGAKKQQQFAEAEVLAQEIIALSATFPHHHGVPEAYSLLGLQAIRSGNHEKALDLLVRARTACEAAGNTSELAKVMVNLSLTYRKMDSFSEAIDCSLSAIELYEAASNTAGMALAFGSLGLVYTTLDIPDKALHYLTKALDIHEKNGDKSQIAGTLSNIGNFYQKIGDYPKALEYSQKALPIAEESGNQKYRANILVNMGNLHRYCDDYSTAIEHLGKGLAIFREIEDASGIASTIYNIGVLYSDMGLYAEALEHLTHALDEYTKGGTKHAIALAYASIGSVYAKQEFEGYNPDKAEEFLLKALELSTSIDNNYQIHEIHHLMYLLYKGSGDTAKALVHLEHYHRLYTVIKGEEATNQAMQMEHRRKVEEAERDRQIKLARFHEQEKILHNILPAQIAERMVAGEKTIADSYQSVSVFFSDIVGFTKLSQQISAEELVGMLNGVFTQFDQLARKHGLEKIKTIGDAYMAVAGAPIAQENHAERAAVFAVEVAEVMRNYSTKTGETISIRIGLHSGSVVAGIIGENKFAYDLWGDAVNTASRMESHGEPGKIHVSEEFARNLTQTLSKREGYSELEFSLSSSFPFREGWDGVLVERGEMEIKGKGMMKTFFLEKI